MMIQKNDPSFVTLDGTFFVSCSDINTPGSCATACWMLFRAILSVTKVKTTSVPYPTPPYEIHWKAATPPYEMHWKADTPPCEMHWKADTPPCEPSPVKEDTPVKEMPVFRTAGQRRRYFRDLKVQRKREELLALGLPLPVPKKRRRKSEDRETEDPDTMEWAPPLESNSRPEWQLKKGKGRP